MRFRLKLRLAQFVLVARFLHFLHVEAGVYELFYSKIEERDLSM